MRRLTPRATMAGKYVKILIMLSAVSKACCVKSISNFSPRTVPINLAWTVELIGSELSSTDMLAVLTDASSCDQNSTLYFSVPSTRMYSVSEAGTSATVTARISSPGTFSVCFYFSDSKAWKTIGTVLVSPPNVTALSLPSQMNLGNQTGSQPVLQFLSQHDYSLQLSGVGLVVNQNLLSLSWKPDNCSNDLSMPGGTNVGLSTANNEGTSGTFTFRLTSPDPYDKLALCLNYSRGNRIYEVYSYGLPFANAKLEAPIYATWTARLQNNQEVNAVSPSNQVTFIVQGTNIWTSQLQASCSMALTPYVICIKIATSCDGAFTDTSDISGGDSVLLTDRGANSGQAVVTFSTTTNDITAKVCARMAGTTVWTQVGNSTFLIRAPYFQAISPVLDSSAAFSVTLTGGGFNANTFVKITDDCSISPTSDTSNIKGGDGRSCTPVSATQCIVDFSGLISDIDTVGEVCMRDLGTSYKSAFNQSLTKAGSVLIYKSVVINATLPSSARSGQQFSITVGGSRMFASGQGSFQFKFASSCSSSLTDVYGSTVSLTVSADRSVGTASFILGAMSNKTVYLCYKRTYSTVFSPLSNYAVFLQEMVVHSFTPDQVNSRTPFSLSLTGSNLIVSALQVKISFDCSLNTDSDTTQVIQGGAGKTSSDGVSFGFELVSTILVSQAQVCWRLVGSSYKQAGSSSLALQPIQITSFTLANLVSLGQMLAIELVGTTGTGTTPIYVKAAADCSSNADNVGTIPGSEGQVATIENSKLVVKMLMLTVQPVTLMLCWRVASSPYMRVGQQSISLPAFSITQIQTSYAISGVPFIVTLVAQPAVAFPELSSNLPIKVKLARDCQTYSMSDASDVTGGDGRVLDSMSAGRDLALYSFNIQVYETTTLQVCWTMKTTLYGYSWIGQTWLLTVYPASAVVSAVSPAVPMVNQPVTLTLLGDLGLLNSAMIPVKVKLSRQCRGKTNFNGLVDIVGGEARVIECASKSTACAIQQTCGSDAVTASISFVPNVAVSGYQVCIAMQSPDLISGTWQTASFLSAVPSISRRIWSPAILNASLEDNSFPVLGVPFTVLFLGVGFSDSGDRVKVKMIPGNQLCGYPFAPVGPSCQCTGGGVALSAGACQCLPTSSDFSLIPNSLVSYIHAVNASSAILSITSAVSGEVRLCSTVEAADGTNSPYEEVMHFSILAPVVDCVSPPIVSYQSRTRMRLVGRGISGADQLKLVSSSLSCSAASVLWFSPLQLSQLFDARVDPRGQWATFTLVSPAEGSAGGNSFIVCYSSSSSKGVFVAVGEGGLQLDRARVSSVSPSSVYLGTSFMLTVRGSGMSESHSIYLVPSQASCSSSSSSPWTPGPLTCDLSTGSERNCAVSMSYDLTSAVVQPINYSVCYSTSTSNSTASLLLALLPTVSDVVPSIAYAGISNSLTVRGRGLSSSLSRSLVLLSPYRSCADADVYPDVTTSDRATFQPSSQQEQQIVLLSLLAGISGMAKVCVRVGGAPFTEAGRVEILPPATQNVSVKTLVDLRDASKTSAGLGLTVLLEGKGLTAPELFLKIVPEGRNCSGSIDLEADVARGGGGQAVTNMRADFPDGILERGRMKVCLLGKGWSTFVEVGGGSFEVISAGANISDFQPKSTVTGRRTRLNVSSIGRASRLGSLLFLAQDCRNQLTAQGDIVPLLDSEDAAGRDAYAMILGSSVQQLSVCVVAEQGGDAIDLGKISFLFDPSFTQVTPTTIMPGQTVAFLLRGAGLSSSNLVKLAQSCGDLTSSSIFLGGVSSPLVNISSSLNEAATLSFSILPAAASLSPISICVAPASGRSYIALSSILVKTVLPSIVLPPAANGLISIPRHFPSTFQLAGTNLAVGDGLVLSKSPCSSASSPSWQVSSSMQAAKGGELKVVTSADLLPPAPPCSQSRYKLVFQVEEVASSLRACYVPLGFSSSIELPTRVAVTYPTLSLIHPLFTFAGRAQKYTLQGSGGYQAGDLLLLVPSYTADGLTVVSCSSVTAAVLSDARTLRYEVKEEDVVGTSFSATFRHEEERISLRACYLPSGSSSLQEVYNKSMYARENTSIVIQGEGLSTSDRLKIVRSDQDCSSLLVVDGGEERSPWWVSEASSEAQLYFELAVTAVGMVKLCYKDRFSCKYQGQDFILLLAPRVLSASPVHTYIIFNRLSQVLLQGRGLHVTDKVRVVDANSSCSSSPPFAFGESGSFTKDESSSGFILSIKLEGSNTTGLICHRYCMDVGCSYYSPYVSSSVLILLTFPQIFEIVPKKFQIKSAIVFTLSGWSFTSFDRVKVFHPPPPSPPPPPPPHGN
ncbi:hypothetical protein GUITHDRAFT_104682 [Guillardia theta CCMP2712]|uniref:Uncharacterized protein n=1 Tax=Guillardia theta (strain CCMP2712) TaxID=905079 RepID=L1JNR4_GUITC|nr:hypothetical protein GUITHDRAFT_104682 [Guillardia theta CCMP2712]EKX49718.1 hypothetical protein GUITHDRAFT_104682 [Guillardia theta CCMP2712]|eukprot:XP_005836698.1 hypothetical protein GUITHDRAFT_104682 [Guillardia theta CCMP2712]